MVLYGGFVKNVFFFKQKTAYEMRISDWSSDVCSSDLFDATLLADSRLFADMFPLVRQVQIATDGAKGCAARLAGTEAPKFEDTEKTLPEILASIDKTVAFLNSVKADQVDGSEKIGRAHV